jgi:MSHA pilin protein MshA
MLKKKLKNQKGFTLIEIIAVLVILGILAAVAIPKFLDLQDEAKKKAMQGAVAEGMSTVSMAYGKLLLSNSGVATTGDIAIKAQANAPGSDEFAYTFTPTGAGVLVAVDGKSTSGFSGAPQQTKTWKKP